MTRRYQALGPLLSGEGSRAFLGLSIDGDGAAEPVVLVWVPEGVESDPALLAKIRKETEHAAILEHPHIVRVFGFAHLDEGHARVVEFADGESLRKLLDEAKKLPANIAAKIVADAAIGVHYAHLAGNDDGTPLVHGDVRPETLLISFSGVTKVTGYGALAFAPREMGGQRVKGRRVHTAPEQIIGGRDAYRLETDVYLLGLTLSECLTGVVPYADQGDFFDHAVLTLPMPPPPPGEVPEELQKVIDKACSKKVGDRYSTPLAMKEAIEKAVGGTLISDEELGTYLKEHFPDNDKVRAGRRQALDAGIADLARRQWAERKTTTVETPVARTGTPVQIPISPTPISVPVVPQSPVVVLPPNPKPIVPPYPPAPPTPVAAPARRAAPEEPPPEPEKVKAGLMPIIGVTAVVALVFLLIVWSQSGPKELPPSMKAAMAADAGSFTKPVPPPVVAAEVPDAAVAEVTGGAAADAGPAPVVDAGAVAKVIDAGVAAAASADVRLAIDVNPDCELTIDNKPAGKTPWKGALTPGRHLVIIANKDLGIRTARSIVVTAGEQNDESWTIGKGSITIGAPEGAQVFIDDHRIGSAPIRGEVPVYEGSHRILVNVGKAHWSDNFNIESGGKKSFNVEMQ